MKIDPKDKEENPSIYWEGYDEPEKDEEDNYDSSFLDEFGDS